MKKLNPIIEARKADQIRRRNEREQAQRDIREADQRGYRRGQQSATAQITNRVPPDMMDGLLQHLQREWVHMAVRQIIKSQPSIPYEIIHRVSKKVWDYFQEEGRLEFDGYAEWLLREEIERDELSLTIHVPTLSYQKRITAQEARNWWLKKEASEMTQLRDALLMDNKERARKERQR